MNSAYEISIAKNGEALCVARMNFYTDHKTKFAIILSPPAELSDQVAEAIEICIASDNACQPVGGIKHGTDLYSWKFTRI